MSTYFPSSVFAFDSINLESFDDFSVTLAFGGLDVYQGFPALVRISRVYANLCAFISLFQGLT